MELWEYNACVRAFNNRRLDQTQERLAQAWQTAAFVGAAFAGKLKPLTFYLKNEETKSAPKISKEEFERRLKLLEGRSG